MASNDYDAPPRDDILPSPEEIRRAPVSPAPHPDEFDSPDDVPPDDDSETTRARVPAVTWAQSDTESADYAHLLPQGREPVMGDKKFTLTAADLELLIKANGFDPKGPDSRIVFALRGSNLIDKGDANNDGMVAGVDAVPFEETRPDHKTFRCTIGYFNRATRKISAYRASTVPNSTFMTNYYKKVNGLGTSNTGANMMPTGCYVYRMGAHGGGRIYPALRLTDPENMAEDGAACVFRTTNDLTFKIDDVFDQCMPYDNIHCAYSYDTFSSAGCQTIQGPNGEGPWGAFQAVLKTMKVNTRIDYMMLTGRDASIAVWLRETGKAGDAALVNRLLGRLRPGSRGDAVSRLQKELGLKESGYFGPSTKKKLGELQRSKGMVSDGIWSPAVEDKLGWAVLTAPAATTVETTPAAVPTPVPPAVSSPSQPPSPATPPAPAAVAPAATPPPVPAAAPAPAVAETPLAPPVAAAVPVAKPDVAPAAAAAASAVAAAATSVASPTPLTPAAAPTPTPPSQPPPVAPTPAPPVMQPSAVAASPVAAVPGTAVPVEAPRPTPPAPPPSAPVKPAAPPAAAAPAPHAPRPSGVSAAVAAELEKLSHPPDASPEAPGIVDMQTMRGTRSPDLTGLSPAASSLAAEPSTGAAGAPAGSGSPAVVATPAAPPAASPAPPPATVAAPAIAGAARKLIIDKDRIAAFASRALPQYRDALLAGNEVLTRYGINQSPMRLAHFLGQIGNECGRLTILDENMTYRSAARLRAVWPTRFPTLSAAEPFVNNPQKLAEKVYGGRFDNRPGDGWRYRGRGLVQITGRSSYREMGKKLNIPLEDEPDLAFDQKHALAIACETWAAKTLSGERDMNKLADANKLDAMTYRINGGYTNIDDRRDAFEEAWDIWGTGKAPRRVLEPDTLDRGDRAGKVEELNARLDELGLFEGVTASRPTQVYNLSTYKAVRALQENVGLNQTGVVGTETWAALEKVIDRGGISAGGATGGATRAPDGGGAARPPKPRDAVGGRLKEIRAWSVALALLAVAFVGGYVYALTNPTGNTPLWMPLVFAGMVFVTGLALWLAARPGASWKLEQPGGDSAAGRTRSAPAQTRRPPGGTGSFIPDEEEPVRLGVNAG